MMKKGHRSFVPDPHIDVTFNIPYLDDGDENHKIDVYHARKKRKNKCIIDIHGGAYLFGHRLNNYRFAKFFVERGFDVVTLDYVPNKKKRGTLDIVEDCATAISYISKHLEELELQNDAFILCGDSAGGHMALLLTEMINNPSFSRKITLKQMDLEIKAVLLNCLLYDYVNAGEGVLTEHSKRYMFGPNYRDVEERKLIDPRTNIHYLNVPLFVSTCRNDFIRNESLMLHDDLNKMGYKHTFIDIDSYDKQVGHVHNIMNMELEESKIINNAMVDFINSNN